METNMIPPKEANNTLTTNAKEMEIYELPDKEFKIIILMKLSEMQENRNRQQNKVKKTVCEQNEKFNKEIEDIRKN